MNNSLEASAFLHWLLRDICYCPVLDVTAHWAEGLVALTTVLANRSAAELSLVADLQGGEWWCAGDAVKTLPHFWVCARDNTAWYPSGRFNLCSLNRINSVNMTEDHLSRWAEVTCFLPLGCESVVLITYWHMSLSVVVSVHLPLCAGCCLASCSFYGFDSLPSFLG